MTRLAQTWTARADTQRTRPLRVLTFDLNSPCEHLRSIQPDPASARFPWEGPRGFAGASPRSIRHSDTAMEHRSAANQRRGVGVGVGVVPKFLPLADSGGLVPRTISQACQ